MGTKFRNPIPAKSVEMYILGSSLGQESLAIPKFLAPTPNFSRLMKELQEY